jgi:hypothetical protein
MALVVASSTATAEPKNGLYLTKQLITGSQYLRHFVSGLPTIQHPGNTRNLNAKVGTKQIRLDASSSPLFSEIKRASITS